MHARKEHLPEEIIRIKNYIQKHAFSDNIDFISALEPMTIRFMAGLEIPRIVINNVKWCCPAGLTPGAKYPAPCCASDLPHEMQILYGEHWNKFRDYWDIYMYPEKGSLSKCMIWLMGEPKYKLYRKLGKIKFENGR